MSSVCNPLHVHKMTYQNQEMKPKLASKQQQTSQLGSESQTNQIHYSPALQCNKQVSNFWICAPKD